MVQEKITSKQMLVQMQADHYANALKAKEEGKPVVWSASIAMQELLETMGLTVVYPENHAAAIGARKCSPELIADAEGHGYSSDLCSYARVNLGYVNVKHSEAQNIPLPDILFCCDNLCHTVVKWYENLAKELGIPMIMINTPFVYDDEVPDRSVKYMRAEFERAIRQLEEYTHTKFDYDKLSHVMKNSNTTAEWWEKAYRTAMQVPSPLSGFDMFNYMAVAVCMRGKEEGATLFKLWYEELQNRAEKQIGPWDNATEKYRILWDGIACWPYLSTTFKILKKNGINMVASTYPDIWNLRYETDDLDGLVKAYAKHYANRNLKFSVDKITQLAKDYQLDGIIYHSNRSCKLMDFRQYEIQRQVQERTGIPSIIFDGDQTDPRVFSEAQYETRIQALVEVMKGRRKAGMKNGRL